MGAVVGRFRRKGGADERGQASTVNTRIKRWQEGSPQDANRILDLSSCGLVALTKTKVRSVGLREIYRMFTDVQILADSLSLGENSTLEPI